MPTAPRRRQHSSSESSDVSSSSNDDDDDDDELSLPSTVIKRTELTLKDDDNMLNIQAPLPEDYGESDDERRVLPRVVESSASGLIDDEKKQQIAKKKRKRTFFICVSMCKYECVRRAAKRLNFREVSDDDDWNIYWTDTSVGIERVAQMKKWQKINHFPGMSEICRKDSLTRNMSRMMKMFPKDYAFYPKAWCLPADYNDFTKYCSAKKYKTYISKPDVGCQGRGIFITKNPSKDIKPTDNFVVQVYVNRPFLVDGYKFDFRVYVAVTSCDPFRIFVYKDGLARFTTQHYEEPSNANCKDIFMHLTNYAIQKRSEDFIRDEDTGTKRRITTINRWLVEHGYDIVRLWSDIDDVIIKVLISAHSVLKHNYRACFPHHYRGSACFEILGFDILIDRKLKPYVLEVNHSPSFTTDSKLDRDIKDALIYDTLLLLNMPAADKRRFLEEEKRRVKERLFQRANKKDNEFRKEQEDLAQQWQQEIEKWEDEHMGNYRRIYPIPNLTEKYDPFFTQSGTLYSETAASKARIEQAKVQIDELQKKQDQLNSFTKTSKSSSNNPRESYGESPTKRTLPLVKSSRSSSFNRPHIKRLTVSISLSSSTNHTYGDTAKPITIDETEEIERVIALKHRETLIRGMGIVDMCHRVLFGTSGTMANAPLNSFSHSHPQTMPQIEGIDPSRNLSLIQYVDSKLPNRQTKTSTQALQQYFTNQQSNLSQNASRNGRYQQPLRSSIQTNLMPQIAANFLPKTPLTLESSIRKSATTIPRQRTGDAYLVSYGSYKKKPITVHDSSIPVTDRFQTLGLLPLYERVQQATNRKNLLSPA